MNSHEAGWFLSYCILNIAFSTPADCLLSFSPFCVRFNLFFFVDVQWFNLKSRILIHVSGLNKANKYDLLFNFMYSKKKKRLVEFRWLTSSNLSPNNECKKFWLWPVSITMRSTYVSELFQEIPQFNYLRHQREHIPAYTLTSIFHFIRANVLIIMNEHSARNDE